LLTDRQTDRQTRTNAFTSSFVGGNKFVYHHNHNHNWTRQLSTQADQLLKCRRNVCTTGKYSRFLNVLTVSLSAFFKSTARAQGFIAGARAPSGPTLAPPIAQRITIIKLGVDNRGGDGTVLN